MNQDAKPAKEVSKEDWMNKKWRPAMGWTYMAVCIFDFMLAPILWSLIQFYETEAANDAFRQWVPLTLQGGGLFHLAMGAVLGISAYGRTQEKVAGVNAEPVLPTTNTAVPAAPVLPKAQPAAAVPAVAAPAAGTVTAAPAAEVLVGWGGKKAPPAVTEWPER